MPKNMRIEVKVKNEYLWSDMEPLKGIFLGQPGTQEELKAMIDSAVRAEREACKRDCREVQQAHIGLVLPYHVVAGECIEAIDKRANTK